MIRLLSLLLVAVPMLAFAEGEFEVQKGVLDTIYKGTLEDTAAKSPESFSSLVITPQVSFVTPQKLRVTNSYFDVSHAESLRGVPAFGLAVQTPWVQFSGFTVSPLGGLSYAFRESATRLTSMAGPELVDLVKVHWLTLDVALTLDYEIPRVSWLRPFVQLGSGVQWLYQNGNLDGLEQGFWIPFYAAKAGLNLFTRPRVPSEWFGGFVVASTLRRSFGSQTQVESWSLDLGLNLYL